MHKTTEGAALPTFYYPVASVVLKNLPIMQGNEAFVLVVFNAFFFSSHNLTIMLCVILFAFILLDLFCLEYTESLKAMC